MPVKPSKPPPVGPLARVPSDPSFVPVMTVDLDAIAEDIGRKVDVDYTTEQLLSDLAGVIPTPPQHDVQPDVSADQSISELEAFREGSEIDPNAPLQVTLAEDESTKFSDEAIVLKISQHQRLPGESIGSEEGFLSRRTSAVEKGEIDTSAGFAINIPVQTNIESDQFENEAASSWGFASHFAMPERDYDEEDPLIPEETGLNMSFKGASAIPSEGTAFVQRKGPRDVAEEQEVLYAMPKAHSLGKTTTGLLLPVVDSKDDLRQLMFVVPPEAAVEDEEMLGTEVEEPMTTAEATREYMESLTNNLPSFVEVESTLEVSGTAENATVAMNVTKQVSWVGYIILTIALLSVASQGTAVKYLPSVDGLIAAAWLMQTETLLMIPLALFQYFTLNSEELAAIHDPVTQRQIVAASVSQVCWAAGFFMAIDLTSLFHAWSFNNVHALLIVLLALGQSIVLRRRNVIVSRGEIMGAFIATAGVFVMVAPLFVRGDVKSIVGDVIAVCSSFGAIMFLNLCKALRSKIPLFLMMAPITAMNSVWFSLASMLVNGTDFSVSDHGAFGWMRSDRILLGMYLGGVVGFLGTVCCIAALKYLPSVVVGSVQTMMPVVGTLVAVLLGFDKLPDLWTTIGGAVLLYGVLVIADATRRSEVKVVINSHIQQAGASKVT